VPRITYTLELEFEIEADVSPVVPARLCGPPEACYPEEGGEVDIREVRLIRPNIGISDDLRKAVERAICDLLAASISLREPIEEELAEAAHPT
jgi:hypothetical protein